MNNFVKHIGFLCIFFIFLISGQSVYGNTSSEGSSEHSELDVRELILDHVADSYEWHITDWKGKHVSIPLPVIIKGENSGWHIFLSSNFHHGSSEYKGFYISKEGKYKGKIVEKNQLGEEVKPIDISITKNVFSLLFSCILLVTIILACANWYKKRSEDDKYKVPKGFIGLIEMLVVSIYDDLIKPCIGKDSDRYTPYLLTVFFFIFLNNLLGIIPIFPGGANVTGNISITVVLALFTFFIVNIFGSREYWKDIFWPNVPTWLKVPIPIMPAIEIIGIFTKPFALMIRLFANILAGHSIVLGITCLVFVTVSLGTAINTSMSILSIILSVFMNLVELLVAYIQAYVFTMLSAVFIGLSRIEPHKSEKH